MINLGYQLIAVSADRREKIEETAGSDSISFTKLSDSDMSAAVRLGIAFRVEDEMVSRYKLFNMDIEEASGKRRHILPVPSVFIIGTDSVIDFAYVNPDYKVRLKPELLLAAARAFVE